MQCVRNCDSTNPRRRAHFEQPVLQTAQMFVGEMGCWLVVGLAALYRRLRKTSGHQYEPLAGGSAANGATTHGSPDEQTLVDGNDYDGDEDRHDDVENEEDEGENPLAKSLTLRDADGRKHMGGWKVCLLALPACCDITATTLMNVGLLFVAASIYQMTRGALVLFVGLFSVIFLGRKLGPWKWFSLMVVVLGVAVVGLAGALQPDEKAVPKGLASAVGSPSLTTGLDMHTEMKAAVPSFLRIRGAGDDYDDAPDPGSVAVQTVLGVLLIALAQIFTASQFVLEESIMEKYSIEPLKAVGWEGIWGFVVTVLGMAVLHFAYGRTDAGRYGYFDAQEGLRQMAHDPAIAISSVLIMVSIG